MEKTCCRCKKLLPLEKFNFKNKLLNIRQKACKNCTRSEIRDHYYKNKEYYLNKAKLRNYVKRNLIKIYIFDYLNSHPCVDCGENDPIVLEFDHKTNKSHNISSIINGDHSLELVKIEINKCEVRCSNCHKRKTAKDFGWYKAKLAPVA